jgi:hypothetical protein
VIAAIEHTEEFDKRLEWYKIFIPLVPDSPYLQPAIVREQRRFPNLADRSHLMVLLAQSNRQKWVKQEANHLLGELTNRLRLSHLSDETFTCAHQLVQTFFLLGDVTTARHLLQRLLGIVSTIKDDDDQYSRYLDIAQTQSYCGWWQDAVDTVKKISKPTDVIYACLGIAQGNTTGVWDTRG